MLYRLASIIKVPVSDVLVMRLYDFVRTFMQSSCLNNVDILFYNEMSLQAFFKICLIILLLVCENST